jgi:uncharacterized membrane protein YoaK (UPF0700 family)
MFSSMAQAESLPQRAAASINHPLSRALLTLTFTTGIVDGVSYLGLGHVFTANMTGNVVLLGFGIAGGYHLPVLAPIVSLLAFLIGAGVGGMLATRTVARHYLHFGLTLVIEFSVLVITTVIAALKTPHVGAVGAYLVIALLALAMGVRNQTVRKIGVPDLTTTVLTMTLTSLAGDSPLAGGKSRGTVRRTAAVVIMLAGALVGALELKTSITLPLATAAALAAATAVLYVPAARREAGRRD